MISINCIAILTPMVISLMIRIKLKTLLTVYEGTSLHSAHQLVNKRCKWLGPTWVVMETDHVVSVSGKGPAYISAKRRRLCHPLWCSGFSEVWHVWYEREWPWHGERIQNSPVSVRVGCQQISNLTVSFGVYLPKTCTGLYRDFTGPCHILDRQLHVQDYQTIGSICRID